MPKKKTSEQLIEELALMVGKGFEETNSKITALTKETRDGLGAVNKEMRDGFSAVNERLDRVEFHVNGQGRRIDVLEDRVLQIARKMGLQFK